MKTTSKYSHEFMKHTRNLKNNTNTAPGGWEQDVTMRGCLCLGILNFQKVARAVNLMVAQQCYVCILFSMMNVNASVDDECKCQGLYHGVCRR